jgi:hypothetical protein
VREHARRTHERMIRDRRIAEIAEQMTRAQRLIDAPTSTDELRATLREYVDTLTRERALLTTDESNQRETP